MKVKYKDIPFLFVNENWNKAVDYCDKQTPMFCYCGRLATGFHINSCRKFITHVHRYIENLYNNKGGKE